jgi:hypothetical protein
MSLLLLMLLAAAQPNPSSAGPPPPASPATIRPGETPSRVSIVPISQVAEPLGLAVAGFDANHDATTTLAEYEEALGRTFAASDRDGGGSLGYLEYSRWAETWLGSQSALPGPFAIDADGDNRLSREEFMAEFKRHFTRLDIGKDGAVSRAELLTVRNPAMRPLWDRNGRPIRVRPEREEPRERR